VSSVRFSVVVAAFDASATLGDTLESLMAQTFAGWEAVIVDDGSRDATAEVANACLERDRRIRLLRAGHSGVATARNLGIEAASHEWVLFLDADDWLTPQALEAFAGAIGQGDADAVYGAWSRVAADGTITPESFRPDPDQLFETLARCCPFAIHACTVRRRMVDRIGAFDPRYRVGEDWDFWQRVARGGGRFIRIDTEVARYRTRAGSAGLGIQALLENGLEIIDRGHHADPRVPDPDPRVADGCPAMDRSAARLAFACWPAGMLLGAGEDARGVLDAVSHDRDADMDASAVAASIFRSGTLPGSVSPNGWPGIWPGARRHVAAFLAALEHTSGTPMLARRATRELERMIVEAAALQDLTIGTTAIRRVEVISPIDDIVLPGEVERLIIAIAVQGEDIGVIELPVCDGIVPRAVVRDAIVAHHAWPILGRFFARTVYRSIRLTDGVAWRGPLALASRLGPDVTIDSAALHDAIGWVVFLQELWGRPGWTLEQFYDAPPDSPPRAGTVPARIVEASGEVPSIRSRRPTSMAFTVGSAPVAVVHMPQSRAAWRPRSVIGVCTREGGYEMCRVAVREALLGASWDAPGSLRQRLAAAARRAPTLEIGPSRTASIRRVFASLHRTSRRAKPSTSAPSGEPDRRLATGWRSGLVLDGDDVPGAAFIAHRRVGVSGTSVSRRAHLPLCTGAMLAELAAADGEPVLSGADPIRWLYAPGILWSDAGIPDEGSRRAPRGSRGARDVSHGFDRHYFESIFTAHEDPWRYDSAFERKKHEQTLAMIGDRRPARALELACAEGVFTHRLAGKVDQLVATDISQLALSRARARCQSDANVRFEQLDLARNHLPGRFDLIVCSEVLYYLDDLDMLRALARRLAHALEPDGILIVTHCNVVRDDPAEPGLAWAVPFGAKVIGRTIAETPELMFERELRTSLYRVQRFRRRRANKNDNDAASEPVIIEHALHAELPEHLKPRFLLSGGSVDEGGIPALASYRLPILMYHRIAASGGSGSDRYRVDPGRFAEQLGYLRDSGFRTVSFAEWRCAKDAWQPLPGRCVALTFDDGFHDFAAHAWPLLRRFGFGATLFVVSDFAGRQNAWDAHRGDTSPLLSWDELRVLHAEGLEIGSHSASHPFLTALSPADVVREATASRTAIQRQIGARVTAFAYPHGAEDRAVQHLVGACGYLYGLSCRPGASELSDPLLALPRIEIRGGDTIEDFIRKLAQREAVSGST